MRLRRLVALVLCVACAAEFLPGLRVGASAAARAQVPGTQQPSATAPSGLTISGKVVREDGRTVADVRLRLRNVDKGTIVGQTVSAKDGAFAFPVSEPGLYIVEAVNEDGSVLAVSSSVSSATTPLTVNVILPTIRAAAFFSSTAFLLLSSAAGAGIVALVIAGDDDGPPPASPER